MTQITALRKAMKLDQWSMPTHRTLPKMTISWTTLTSSHRTKLLRRPARMSKQRCSRRLRSGMVPVRLACLTRDLIEIRTRTFSNHQAQKATNIRAVRSLKSTFLSKLASIWTITDHRIALTTARTFEGLISVMSLSQKSRRRARFKTRQISPVFKASS